ncbi:hypothetical protein G4D62_24215 [Bacillus shackletonii]|nr:hypothetical protein [Heyndrickxia shackletonii]NEZ02369.1 hypothetical protein [Heyndrickxia shackletonii]
MKEYYKEKCPSWANNVEVKNDLILGDDIDSLATCNLLTDITNENWKVNYFYNFKDFYIHTETELSTIGVDMAFTRNVKCFDNHVSKEHSNSPYNPFCMNLNLYKGVSRENYGKKYSMSTLLMVMSYYDIPLPKSQEGKELLLAVDTAFKGYYSSYFNPIHTNWLEILEYTELIDILKQRDSKYFYDIIKYFGLHEKVWIDENGFLQSNIKLEEIQPYFDWKLELPKQQFSLRKECIREGHEIGKKSIPERSQLISLAFTSKNYISYTYKA